jgi:hypothetical protein
VVFTDNAFGEHGEGLRLLDELLQFIEERGAFRRIGYEDNAGLGAELTGA